MVGRNCTGGRGVNYSVLVATWPIVRVVPVSRANAPEHFSGLVMINYDHSKLMTSKFRRLTRTHGPYALSRDAPAAICTEVTTETRNHFGTLRVRPSCYQAAMDGLEPWQMHLASRRCRRS